MLRQPRLQRRGHRWYCRVKVPTTDHSRPAHRRLPEVSAETNALLARARRGRDEGPATAISAAELTGLVRRWFAAEERRSQERERSEIPATRNDEVMDQFDHDLGVLTDCDDPSLRATVHSAAAELMSANRLNVAPGSQEYADLWSLLNRAMIEGARRTRSRVLGDYSDRAHDPVFAREVEEDAGPGPDGAGVTVAQLVERYLSDPARANVGEKTQGTIASRFLSCARLWVRTGPRARSAGRTAAGCARSWPRCRRTRPSVIPGCR